MKANREITTRWIDKGEPAHPVRALGVGAAAASSQGQDARAYFRSRSAQRGAATGGTAERTWPGVESIRALAYRYPPRNWTSVRKRSGINWWRSAGRKSWHNRRHGSWSDNRSSSGSATWPVPRIGVGGAAWVEGPGALADGGSAWPISSPVENLRAQITLKHLFTESLPTLIVRWRADRRGILHDEPPGCGDRLVACLEFDLILDPVLCVVRPRRDPVKSSICRESDVVLLLDGIGAQG